MVGALTSGDLDALTTIPGVTSEIASAGGLALQQAYNVAFGYAWAAAAAFCVPALIGKCPNIQHHYWGSVLTTRSATFLKEAKEEFTAAIDAPLDVQANPGLDAEAKKEAGQ